MSLTPGQKLAHYEILEPIGEGGMGEVYRARDQKLGRDVAIKTLPDEFSEEEERLARFKREAKVLASLNHANIASIYGFEECDETHFLVLELVEGETLADRIARGPIPVDEALAIANRIAAALEDAHEHGIVHRDLKPANIKLTPEDEVKVLDFGLAKALVDETGANVDSSLSPTITKDATRVGVIMGTAAYMSPEQAKGKRVDKRTDIFAFGAVLYEMLTGKKSFGGDDVSEILAAVIKSDPDWLALPRETPAGVRALLEKCLEKDRQARLRDIGDAPLLQERAPVPVSRTSYAALIAAVLAASVAFAVGRYLGSGPPGSSTSSSAPIRARIPLPEGTSLGGFGSTVLAISRDGTKVAVVAEGDGVEQLFVLDLTDGSSQKIPDSAGAEGPFFSPDGNWVGFAVGVAISRERAGELRKVSLDGGLPQKVCDLVDYFGGTWGDDGFIYYAEDPTRGIRRIESAGGEPEVVSPVKMFRPDVIPGANAMLAQGIPGPLGGSDNIVFVDLSDGDVTDLGLSGSTPRYARSGHVLYAGWDGSLMAAPLDVERREITGPPVALIGDLSLSRHFAAVADVSEDGSLVYATGYVRNSERELLELVRVGSSGETDPLPFEPTLFRDLAISRDGAQLLATTADERVWVHDLERGTRLVLNEVNAQAPLWAPDGERAFYSIDWALHSHAADGSEPAVLLLERPGEQHGTSLTPDGSTLVFYEFDPVGGTGAFDIYVLDLNANASDPRPLVATTANEIQPRLSPDGRWIAYASNETGRLEVYARAFPDLKQKTPISRGGGVKPRWASDGRELYYQTGDTIRLVDVVEGSRLVPGTPRKFYEADGIQAYDVLPNGDIVVAQRIAGGGRHTELELVLNWFTELERLVPSESAN